MALLLERTLQTFKSEDGTRFSSLLSHVCDETGERYVSWEDIRQAFEGVFFVKLNINQAATFMINNNGILYVPSLSIE